MAEKEESKGPLPPPIPNNVFLSPTVFRKQVSFCRCCQDLQTGSLEFLLFPPLLLPLLLSLKKNLPIETFWAAASCRLAWVDSASVINRPSSSSSSFFHRRARAPTAKILIDLLVQDSTVYTVHLPPTKSPLLFDKEVWRISILLRL